VIGLAIPITFGNLLLKLELMGVNVIKPRSGRYESGPYAPPIITCMDGEAMEQFS